MTKAIISHIQEGSIGMKKNRTDVTRQMRAAKVKALFFEPAHWVNFGERPPATIQTTSPKVIKTV